MSISPKKSPRGMSSSGTTQVYVDEESPPQVMHAHGCYTFANSCNVAGANQGNCRTPSISLAKGSGDNPAPCVEEQQQQSFLVDVQPNEHNQSDQEIRRPRFSLDAVAHISNPAERASAVVQLVGGKEEYMNILKSLYCK